MSPTAPKTVSMTGFGAAVREADGLVARAELRSVNHRALDVKLRGASYLDAHAGAFEAIVRRRVTRGALQVHLSLERTRDAGASKIVRGVVAHYAAEAKSLAADLGTAPPTLGDLLRLPGALEDVPDAGLDAREFQLLTEALDAALADLVAAREREGAALAAELRALVDQIEVHAGRVEARAPAAVLAQRDRLRERLDQLLAPGQAVPDEVLAREIAVLADRTDVAEEVARLRAHVAEWRRAMDEGGPVGRRLDFLTQELGREANTIGSKCQDTEIARTVIDVKVAVERLKEQAANLE